MDTIIRRIIFPLTRLALCICLALSVTFPPKVAASGDVSKKEDNYRAVQKYLAKGESSRQVLTPEGHFVTVFNPKVAKWLQRRWTLQDIHNIRKYLAPSLYIPLTPPGVCPGGRQIGCQKQQEKRRHQLRCGLGTRFHVDLSGP